MEISYTMHIYIMTSENDKMGFNFDQTPFAVQTYIILQGCGQT